MSFFKGPMPPGDERFEHLPHNKVNGRIAIYVDESIDSPLIEVDGPHGAVHRVPYDDKTPQALLFAYFEGRARIVVPPNAPPPIDDGDAA